ncbi:MAG: DUF4178 domain-containing protein [Vicinamibacteria bacterium]
MSYEALCPSCGAAVVFAFDASVVRVCPSCRSLLVREGASIANAGRVAEIVSTPSLLKLGEVGSWQRESFQIIGRVQIEHAAGVWDEWRIVFGDGRFGWIAESLGRRHLLIDVPTRDLPEFGKLRAGDRIYASVNVMVTELGEARAHTLAGELPQDLRPGDTWRYADVAGPKGAFGTIDYGEGETAVAMFMGSAATLEQLGLAHLATNVQAAKAAAKALQCPQCGGALTLRLPDLSQRMACPYCGTLLAVEGELKAVEVPDKQSKLSFKLQFPLGAKARLDGATWIVLGAMERSAAGESGSESDRFRWREYLLHEPARGFRWLVEDRGHWCVVDNAHAGELAMVSTKTLNGVTYKHFVSSQARVDSLVGEFPWAVARGELTSAIDYIAPPMILSEEFTGTEFTVSVGRYIERGDVEKAFGMKSGSLPRPSGVHPAQPNPVTGLAGTWAVAGMLIVGIVFLFALLSMRTKTVYQTTVRVPPGVVSGAPDTVFISEPFTIGGAGNVEIEVSSSLNNQWLYVDGTLASTKDELAGDFEAEAGFYQGVTDGESWSEGSNKSLAYIGRVPAGEYTLRLAPQWGAIAPAVARIDNYHVQIRRSVPRGSYLLIAIVLIVLWPIVLSARRMSFETSRWSESDHAGGG